MDGWLEWWVDESCKRHDNVFPVPYFSITCETLSLSEISRPNSIDRLKIALLPPSSVRGFPQSTDSHLDWGGERGFQDSTKVVERSPDEIDSKQSYRYVDPPRSSLSYKRESGKPKSHFCVASTSHTMNNILPIFLQTNVVTTEAKEITSERVKNPRFCNFGDLYKYLDRKRSGWKLLRAQKSWRISVIPSSRTISSSRVKTQGSEGGRKEKKFASTSISKEGIGLKIHVASPSQLSSLFPLSELRGVGAGEKGSGLYMVVGRLF
ncbi:hypothetical protein C4D60_Mb10t09820 [Musa balbisiana]|uniref:Uncharacterized protein n=1 Tax=Musa balbisiana TaxID=52838 RepID=A0A4S8IWR8_MUSBA|nr:hypothetical protein C4D60_Mb10t09820 [Musa balbisiana]